MTARALVEAMAALVIFLTLAGLGLFQVPSEDATIEAGLQAQATAQLADLPNPPTLTVTGRDIAVAGRVQSHAVRRQIESGLRGIDGVRDVTARLEVLPEVAEFTFAMQKDAAGMALAGQVRRAATLEALADLTAAPLTDIALASGGAIDGWDDAVLSLARVAAQLDRAEVTLTGTTARISGVALWPSDLEAIDHVLAELPKDITVTSDLTARDDGLPFVLIAEKQPGLGVRLRGKLPATLSPKDLSEVFGPGVRAETLTVGPVDPGYPALAAHMLAAARVLHLADQGVVTVTPAAMLLSALRGGAEVDRALDALRANLPGDTLLDVSRIPLTDPEPFWLDLERRNGTVTVRGVVPVDLAQDTLAAAFKGADVSGLRHSLYPDITGWTAGLDAVSAAFGEVVAGRLLLEQGSVTLDALLPDPARAERVDRLLAALPQGQDFRRTVALVDDGLMLNATLTYAPQMGARIEGTLPGNLAAAELPDLLGLPDVAGEAGSDADMPLPRATAVLLAVERWLGEAEDLTLTLTPEQITLDAVLSPGVDLAQIDAAMRAVLDPQDTLRLRPLSDRPPAGATRRNVALGLAQVFVAGYWLPVLDFTPSVAECARQSLLAERADPVRFLSGSARLDARSVRGVNALAAVARVCVSEGGLQVQVEGHTDAFGAEAANRAISRDRAVVVAVEISKRGVRAGAMNVVGFGPSRPVADNGTEAGRALNRRISLFWRAPGQAVQ
ncbi:OmpA family protein [Antarctobacter heliothermus]|uniref:OmpA-OmpF porin, OOP family n=1 Tax=Antarctobacter heliothermus TaxID=74033 RepID=A0A239DLM4_9RHOB|nr:OmpA family protein [Antarctobacter heliothermus]SNS33545.1 OmpA-OmpF porin, OOP family [Antarctobacter heliothermus]